MGTFGAKAARTFKFIEVPLVRSSLVEPFPVAVDGKGLSLQASESGVSVGLRMDSGKSLVSGTKFPQEIINQKESAVGLLLSLIGISGVVKCNDLLGAKA